MMMMMIIIIIIISCVVVLPMLMYLQGLRDLSDESSTIRVKAMGRIDEKPFLKVCEQRFSGQDAALQHARLCSKWQKMVMDSRWEPFKIQRSGDKIEVLLCSSI